MSKYIKYKRVIACAFALLLICPVISLGSESVRTIEDGRYSVSVRLWHATNNEASMGDAGISKTGILFVKDGKARIELEMLSMNVGGMIGYLSELNLMEDIKYNSYLYPESYTKVPATTLSTYDVVDDYNSETSKDDNCRGVAYPKKISMPLTMGQEFTWVQMYIPLMGAMGFGEQIAKLRVDYDSIQKLSSLQKSDLQELVDANKKLSSEHYTEESYQIFEQKMNSAQELINQDSVQQTDLENAYEELVEVIGNLVRVKTELPPTDDSTGDNSSSEDSSVDSGETDSDDSSLDKDKLSNGKYEVNVGLWHATSDKESMGNAALLPTALLDVKNGTYTMTIATQEMTVGTITAKLVLFQVKQEDGTYIDAKKTDDTFQFVLPSTDEYIDVKMDPQVEIMGEDPLDARLKISWDTLKSVSSSTTIGGSTASSNTSKITTLKDKKTGIQIVAEANVLAADTSLKVTTYKSGKTYTKAQSILGKNITGLTLYQIQLFDNAGKSVTPDGMVTVKIPVPDTYDAEKIALSRINLNSKTTTKLSGTVSDDTITFITRELGIVAIYEAEEESTSNNTSSSNSVSGTTSAVSSSSTSLENDGSTVENEAGEEKTEDETNEVVKEEALENVQETNIPQSVKSFNNIKLVVAGVVSIVVVLLVLATFGTVTTYVIYKKLRED